MFYIHINKKNDTDECVSVIAIEHNFIILSV